MMPWKRRLKCFMYSVTVPLIFLFVWHAVVFGWSHKFENNLTLFNVQYVASFLAGGGVDGAGRRAYWVWSKGQGWLFICLELQYDEVNCTYRGGGKTLDWTWCCHCTSDLLVAYHLKIPPAKNQALHYATIMFRIQDSVVGIVTRLWAGQPWNHCSTPSRGKIFFSSAKHPDQPWGPSCLLFNVKPLPHPLIIQKR